MNIPFSLKVGTIKKVVYQLNPGFSSKHAHASVKLYNFPISFFYRSYRSFLFMIVHIYFESMSYSTSSYKKIVHFFSRFFHVFFSVDVEVFVLLGCESDLAG